MEKQDGRLTEKFDLGRADRLEELRYVSGEEQEPGRVYQFYHRSRKDGLATRESREWQIKVEVREIDRVSELCRTLT